MMDEIDWGSDEVLVVVWGLLWGRKWKRLSDVEVKVKENCGILDVAVSDWVGDVVIDLVVVLDGYTVVVR